MGVLQRFERRLGGLVEGAFARVFGGVVQPVEVAAALQREAEDKKMIVGQGRLLVPNEFVVELGQSDAQRLEEYDAPLRRELAAMVAEHAQEQGWSFVGPVQVRFERLESLDTGLFRVRSAVVQPAPAAVGAARTADPDTAATPQAAVPHLLVPGEGGERAAMGSEHATEQGWSFVGPVQVRFERTEALDTGVFRVRSAVVQPVPAAPAPVQAGGSSALAPAVPHLLVPGDGDERRVDLSGEVTRIGRSSEADVRLTDAGVSRLHADVRLLGREALLVDLRCTNGTTLNARRVSERPLRDGDRSGVGSSSLVFRQAP